MELIYGLIRPLGIQRIKRLLLLISLLWVILLNPMTIHSHQPSYPNSIFFQAKFVSGPQIIGLMEEYEPGVTVYYLKKGDTLYRLSKNYFTSLSELLTINHIKDPCQLPENMKIYIPPVDYGVYNIQQYRFVPGDTLNKILISYNLSLWQYKLLNPYISNPKPGSIVFLPRHPLERRYRERDFGYLRMMATMIRPVYGMISSRYGFRWGRMHYGVDLAAPAGTPVKAASNGKVVFAGWRGAYGLLVIIHHGQFNTYYGHLSVILIRNGQSVNQGGVIGLVGSTGRAYGSHLHFGVEKYGKKVNPLSYFMKKG